MNKIYKTIAGVSAAAVIAAAALTPVLVNAWGDNTMVVQATLWTKLIKSVCSIKMVKTLLP